MKNTFYRPTEVNICIYQEIVEKLRQNLNVLISGEVSDEEVVQFVETIIHHAKPLPNNNELLFWGLDDPRSMPADGRVYYFYTPTYITVSFMMKALLEIPEKITQLDGFMDTLKRGMLACNGRKFKGSGYEEIGGLIDCLSIFESIDVFLFLRAYPNVCTEFTELFGYAVAWLRSALEKGDIVNEWGKSYTDRARNLLSKLDSRDNSIVFVYGTLMKSRNNHESFLKSSRFVGNGILEGYSLYDLGSYPGIKENRNDKVKGELYEIDLSTLHRLNCLEGEGTLYK
ncbi:MAG: gamma-glutamylcyclotransferase, partial [Clostridiales bacterium]|nr:gamma-glutamylcyclotransferase [Clostridiales bacterium]